MVGTTPRIGLLRHGRKWRASMRMLEAAILNADMIDNIDPAELQLWPTFVTPSPETIALVEQARRQILEICGMPPDVSIGTASPPA